MDFDGAVSSDGARIGVWIRSPFSAMDKVPNKVRVCSYKIAFDCSNNEAEYEALIAGLKILRNLKAKKIAVYGDSELVIKQVKGEFQAKHPRMRAYRNVVLDILKLFSDHTLTCVLRIQNGVVDGLAKAASNLKIPMNSSNNFEIHVKHRPTVLDNQRCWQVFQDDVDINQFLQNKGKFKDTSIDTEHVDGSDDIQVSQMEVLQLKDNVIPKGLIPFEELFDQDDVARKPTLRPTKKGVEEVNIGLAENPKMWGLDFIREIHPASSGQHRWILTATDYFTKWIEAIPTRQATDAVIISFLETNILSRFGCPSKLIKDNAVAFKSKRMVKFCYKYNISLGQSTAYHPQGNGLAKSSNKSLVNIIKKFLEINKKGWHKKLVNALWADKVSQKKSIGMSSFKLMYGTDTVFPTSLVVLVVELLQESGSEEDPMQRRINQMIHLQ
eukprot:PITA_26870